MKSILLLVSVLVIRGTICAQDLPSFKPLRYNEDYSIFKKDSVRNWYRKTKFNPLSSDASSYLSFGGEVRYQYFVFKNEDWGDSPKDKDGYILTRYLFHADLHTGKYLRTFVQLQSSLANGKESSSPVDENQLDLHQAFVDVNLPVGTQTSILARVGRQELSYGSQRLVGVRDGPNNRQSFDAAKIIFRKGKFQADGFFSHYVKSRKKIMDDGFERGVKFWGAYAVINDLPIFKNIDFYYLGLAKDVAVFDDGVGKETRHSFGMRIWKRTGRWSYDFEGLYQSGHFETKKISAWTLSSNTVYNFKVLNHNAEVGLKTELISGDRKNDDDRLNTFNPLFPRGGYFGLAALIGPSNLADIHPSMTLALSKTIQWAVDYDVFWRYNKNDGIYAPSGLLIYSGKANSHKFIGQQYSTDFTYTPNLFLYFRAELTWFLAGDYLKQAGAGKNILFTGLTAQLKF